MEMTQQTTTTLVLTENELSAIQEAVELANRILRINAPSEINLAAGVRGWSETLLGLQHQFMQFFGIKDRN